MATKPTYKAGDAVAFWPLLGGFKPAGSSDLGLIEPLCGYRPPQADVLRQSWKLHNTEVLDVAMAAMAVCATNPLFAQRKVNTKTYKKAGARSATPTDLSNSYAAVLGRVGDIEGMIATAISTENKTQIASNAKDLREDVISTLKAKQSLVGTLTALSVASSFVKDNCVATDKQMSSIFDVSGDGFEAWGGSFVLSEFWKTVISEPLEKRAVEYSNLLAAQELNEITRFADLIPTYQAAYASLITELAKPAFSGSVHSAYFVLENGADGLEENTNAKRNKAGADKMINEYLWNVLVERFEILDSIVGTFFSMVSSTRNVHLPLVQRFMSGAILYCLVPMFTCVDNPRGPARVVLDFFSTHNTKFKSALTAMFSGFRVPALTSQCRAEMKRHLFDRIVHPSDGKMVMLGPRAEDSEKTSNYQALAASVDGSLVSIADIKHLKTLIPQKVSGQHRLLLIDRTPGRRLNLLKAIRATTVAANTEAEKAAKGIAYRALFTNGIAYAKLHYSQYEVNARPETAYFTATSNPLSIVAAAAAGSSPPTASNQRVAPLADKAALTADLLAALDLKPDFVPFRVKKTPKQPQAPKPPPSRPKSAGGKKGQKVKTKKPEKKRPS